MEEQKENITEQSKGQNERKWSSFMIRLLSGLALLLLLFGILPLGGLPVLAFCLLLSLFACHELLHCFSLDCSLFGFVFPHTHSIFFDSLLSFPFGILLRAELSQGEYSGNSPFLLGISLCGHSFILYLSV